MILIAGTSGTLALAEILKGQVADNNIINVSSLLSGLYFLKVENKFISKFIKE